MKDIFSSADKVYKRALNVVNTVASLKTALPATRKAVVPLANALVEYERVRLQRRKIIVEIITPAPVKAISKREAEDMRRQRKREVAEAAALMREEARMVRSTSRVTQAAKLHAEVGAEPRNQKKKSAT